MNSWAAGATYDCNFLCVCVLGDRTAYGLCKEMSHQMKLTHCVNGFVASPSDMPTYGQLGCQGFIVLDKEHRVVCEGTTPFMQARSLAFQHVEDLLDALCNNAPLPDICRGEMAEIASGDLQGARGICMQVNEDKVDFGFLDGALQGRRMTLEKSMVRRLSPDEEDGATDVAGNCADGCKDTCAGGSCASGLKPTGCGCDPSTCDATDKPECEVDAGFVNQVLDVASVKVPSMDADHADCANALRSLANKRSKESLEDVLQCLSGHFAHEEQLFEQFGFGVHVNEKLSAKKSHEDEHRRLLDKVRRQLAATTVPVSFVRELLQ
ncbi:unnamed protein product, partial [Effrenium voratum]